MTALPSVWEDEGQDQEQKRGDGEDGDGPAAEMPAVAEDEQDQEGQPEHAGAEDARVGPGGSGFWSIRNRPMTRPAVSSGKAQIDGPAVHLFQAFEAEQAEPWPGSVLARSRWA